MLDLILEIGLAILFVAIIALVADYIELVMLEYEYNAKKITFDQYYEEWMGWYKNSMLGKLMFWIEEIYFNLK